MLRKLGLAISYFIAIVYFLSILLRLFTVSGMDAEDRARAMLLCPPSFLSRMAE